jgi:alpha-1,2-mannosyltransferase
VDTGFEPAVADVSRNGSACDPLYIQFVIGSAIFFALVEIAYFATSKLPFDAFGYLVGRDFVSTWMGACAALHGHPAVFFDFAHYNEVLRQTFSARLDEHNWSYPPHILLLIWPFGFFPYLWGYAIWAVGGLFLFVWTGRGEKLSWSRILFLALSPMALIGIITGQNGFFTAALLIPAVANWDRRPALSGLLFGLLTVKPQLILLVPVVLVLTRRWRCLAYFGLTTGLMVVLTSVIFGPAIWTDYFSQAVPIQNFVMTHGTGLMLDSMPTPFMNVRLLGLPLTVAWVVQGIASVLSLAAVVWTFWKTRDPMLSTALLLTASLVFTPYAFNYDMPALMIVLAQLRERADNDRTDVKFILAVWVLPVVMMVVGLFGNITGSALVLLAFGNRMLQRLRAWERTRENIDVPLSAMQVIAPR